MSAGSLSTGSTVTHFPFSSFRKKQLSRPVWQAMPPTCSTLRRIASASQSMRISRTFCVLPDSSPLRQSLLRERDQYTASRVSAVFCSASRFIQATVRIRSDEKSCVTTATSSCSFHGTSSSQLCICVVILEPHLDAAAPHVLLDLPHGEIAEMKHARTEH